MKNAIVVGATGDVGLGITKSLLDRDYQVVAVGRTQEKLNALRTNFAPDARLQTVVGSVANEELGRAAAQKALEFGAPQAVIITVNGSVTGRPLLDLTTDDVAHVFRENVLTHHAAAKAFTPIIPDGGVYLGIGGGMADLIFPDMLAVSMAQSAQRTFFRYLAKEPSCQNIHIRELMLYSMIAGRSKAGVAEPHWITADEVGSHVCAVLDDLSTFDGPILTLKSRKQVGQPERKAG